MRLSRQDSRLEPDLIQTLRHEYVYVYMYVQMRFYALRYVHYKLMCSIAIGHGLDGGFVRDQYGS